MKEVRSDEHLSTREQERRERGTSKAERRPPTNGFSAALTGGADCFQDGREFNGDGRWMDGWSGRMTGARGSREEVCNSAPACRMLIFSFFCLTRIDPMMKREALAGDADSRSVGMLQLTTGHEENRDRQRQ